jgi:outer membrane protein TolC
LTLAAQDLPDEATLIATAFSQRAERVSCEADVASASARVQVSRAERRPTVNARVGYEYANPNQLFFPPDDAWNDDAYAGVEVSWRVWDSGLTRGRVAESVAQQRQAELKRDQVDEEIALQVRSARIRLQEAVDRRVVTVRAQDSARRNVEAATSLWKNGMARQSEVLEAQARLADADAEVVNAVADVAVGQATLAFSCGTLVK